jgi:hypothetical protein
MLGSSQETPTKKEDGEAQRIYGSAASLPLHLE